MEISSKHMKVNGINTHYHEEGSGNEKIVLIHGSGPGVSAFANWRLVIPRLSESLHVYAPDIVGFGSTDKVAKEDYTLDLWVNHLIGFIEEVADEPVYLVGNSFGGALSMHVAHRRPDLVKKLILMGTVGIEHKISYGLDRVWGYEPSLETMRELIGLFSYSDAAKNNEELVRLRYEASIEPETRDAFKEMFFDKRQERLDELALPESEIKNIKIETLLFHGLEDQVIPFEETSYQLIQLLPHAELHLFNECGHWTQIEKTDEFINHIFAYINT
ncbi:2-hydroxymuconate semialdehyde hydrolase [Lentibacillus persicus]|uniref:2-hydroxymuconate semialdehyde hydrolase n=1 Tax=Lentibacillus persicus TaxID=640948 RepID=A0A1I1Z134_9BACI|nr:alpha/beta hydrolase [Lentibacillus persicus]SFE24000.1 2-hydroxymuconate semialdehyde hydrolase [Lentibacillus persicus]